MKFKENLTEYTKHDSVLEIDGDRLVEDVTVEILRTIKYRDGRIVQADLKDSRIPDLNGG